jgi:hypothetical protein
MRLRAKVCLLLAIMGFLSCGNETGSGKELAMAESEPVLADQVLVFTKTLGYRHKSIEKGVATLKELGSTHGFEVTQTEDSLAFSSENLKKYQLVVFLSTTMDVLGPPQEKAFEAYIENGGAYLGIHAAADTEYDWPWYGQMAGAWFKSHPKQQEARIEVVDQTHPSTAHLGDSWTHFDELYNYKDISPDIHVLMKLDETTYEGGENGDFHPIAWYHEVGQGRSFYTGLGHTDESWDDAKFRQHLLGAIDYCLGR